jgi:hypothetical protein
MSAQPLDKSRKPTQLEIETKERDAVYQGLGMAITSWSAVEASLFLLFIMLLQAKEPRLASAAFYSIVSFEGKLSMVKAAVFTAFPGTALACTMHEASDFGAHRSEYRHGEA